MRTHVRDVPEEIVLRIATDDTLAAKCTNRPAPIARQFIVPKVQFAWVEVEQALEVESGTDQWRVRVQFVARKGHSLRRMEQNRIAA